ncbi:HAMP domain-containing sensor histidine kinase [Clostridiaceae bacterium M8S5]|nr:HAMP domain-containing sensor histidine kinase [Clostridiaceae bacterium M8S5]
MKIRLKSVTTKTFIVTTLLFVGLLFLNLLGQELLLSRYYKTVKINLMEDKINSLMDEINNSTITPNKLQEILVRFSRNNQISTAVVDSKGRVISGDISLYNSPYFEVMADDKKIYQVSLEGLKLSKNSKVHVQGMLYDYGTMFRYIYPYKIYVDGVESSVDNGASNNNDYIDINGTITDIVDTSKYSEDISKYNAYTVEYIYKVVDEMKNKDTLEKEIENNSFVYKEMTDKNSGLKYIVFRKTAVINGDRYLFLSSMSSQSVDDTISIIRIYNKYLFFIAILLAIIVVFFYSKKISRPLIKLNNIARKMANLDFMTTYDVTTQDEIGELGTSLNTLSTNLNKSINDLKMANKKLEEDIIKEKKLEDSRKELIASMSHELKTPLTIIEGISSGLRDGVYNSNDKAYIESIIEEVKRMSNIIYDMLELSKIESDVYKINKEAFDLSISVLKIHNKLKRLAESKHILVNIDVKEVIVYGDVKKIEQVITNLYSNAIKYTKSNQKINISINEDKENNKVKFTIENTGIHIDEKDINEIWKPFYRIEKSRSRRLGGTGLGLKIVQGILMHHECEFGVINTDDGVMFYFSLNRIDRTF